MIQIILLCVLIQNLYAGVPPDVIEEASKPSNVIDNSLVVYVDKPEIVNSVNQINPSFNSKSITGYVSSHIKNSKVRNKKGTYDVVSYAYDNIEVYDYETIEYKHKNCNYKRDAIMCGNKNKNYTIKTYINIAPHEITVKLILYNPKALIVSHATVTSKEYVRWIKQQEVIITQRQSMTGSSTTVHKPKEELPLKWQIPPNIWEKQFYRASIGLLTSVKLD